MLNIVRAPPSRLAMATILPLAAASHRPTPGPLVQEEVVKPSLLMRPECSSPPTQKTRGRHRFKAKKHHSHRAMWELERASTERQAHANSLRGAICLLRPLLDRHRVQRGRPWQRHSTNSALVSTTASQAWQPYMRYQKASRCGKQSMQQPLHQKNSLSNAGPLSTNG